MDPHVRNASHKSHQPVDQTSCRPAIRSSTQVTIVHLAVITGVVVVLLIAPHDIAKQLLEQLPAILLAVQPWVKKNSELSDGSEDDPSDSSHTP